jgi:hypothetical protein
MTTVVNKDGTRSRVEHESNHVASRLELYGRVGDSFIVYKGDDMLDYIEVTITKGSSNSSTLSFSGRNYSVWRKGLFNNRLSEWVGSKTRSLETP